MVDGLWYGVQNYKDGARFAASTVGTRYRADSAEAPLGMFSADVDLDRLMPFCNKDYHENNHRVLMIRTNKKPKNHEHLVMARMKRL